MLIGGIALIGVYLVGLSLLGYHTMVQTLAQQNHFGSFAHMGISLIWIAGC
jgi:hypothetical protein